MLVQEPVQAAVWDSLNHYQIENATFLAERLFAEVPSAEAQYLLGTCYYRAGKPFQAYTFMHNNDLNTSPECKFLLARCCVDIERYHEAEMMLAGSILSKEKSHEEIEAEFGSLSSQVYALLGDLNSKVQKVEAAINYYKKSLQLNPLMWCSYQKICQLGGKVDCSVYFKAPTALQVIPTVTIQPESPLPVITDTPEPQQQQTPCETMDTPVTETPPALPLEYLSTPPTTQGTPANSFLTPENSENVKEDLLRTVSHAPRTARKPRDFIAKTGVQFPSFGFFSLGTPSPGDPKLARSLVTPSPISLADSQVVDIKAPRKVNTRRQQSQTLMPKPPGFSPSSNTNTRDNTKSDLQSNPPRRSSRLFGNSKSSSVKENTKTKSNCPSPKAPGRKSKTRLSKKQELNELNKGEIITDSKPPSNLDTSSQTSIAHMQHQSLVGVLNLLECIGRAYQSLCQFQLASALEQFSELPENQLKTGWVLCQQGRAYYELQDHRKAEECFLEARKLEPYCMRDMEVFSTILWHQQKDVELSNLAQELLSMDKHSPQTQCAIGNCFSLQKEHDAAIKFFKRAIQVDPGFSYAYTLLGHEYVFTEELDDAMQCFRSAMHTDKRNYKAWYGFGQICYKQEKFLKAEVHFRRALSIHPHSSALLCHLAVVQHAQKKSEAALNTLHSALMIDNRNPLCKFHRASILHACDKHQEALTELDELRRIVPKESLIYFLMGKIHKKLGNTHLALSNFSWAMDLDPKGINNQIKEAIDKRYAMEDDSFAHLAEESSTEDASSSSLEPVNLFHAMESDESL